MVVVAKLSPPHRTSRFHFLAPALVLLLAASPCPASGQDAPAATPGLSPPPELGDGWTCRSPEEVGLDSEPIAALFRRIRDGEFGPVHGVLIARHGRLVVEAYFPGYAFDYTGEAFRGEWREYDALTPHDVASVAKSVTGLLTGIALDRGDLESVEASAFAFFPEYGHLADEVKAQITLGHLLTMTSGLEWNEGNFFYGEAENDIVQLFVVPDPLEYILSRKQAAPPATAWSYNGGGTILLGEIIRQASGKALDVYSEEHLFGPLGIPAPEWERIGDVVYASGGLMLRPRDMAKLGQLVLNGGTWQGRQIVPEAWIKAMTRPHVRFQPSGGYGLHWWTRVYSSGPHAAPAYMADGWGGQRIMVFPTMDLVAVFTGGSYTKEPRLDEAIAHHVLPAVQGSGWE